MARKAKAAKPEKPELFIGSSGEALLLTNSFVELAQHNFKVTPWTAGVFSPSSNTLSGLIRQADKSDYGAFIFAPDDKLTSRGTKYETTRDNVVFELGLFMGMVGPENCFVLLPKNRRKLKIPSDLEGFSPVTYDDERVDDNPQAALAGAYAAIIAEINRRKKAAAAVAVPPTAVTVAPPPRPTPTPARLEPYVQDLLGMIPQGVAGLEVKQQDQDNLNRWVRNVLHMTLLALQSVTPGLPDDAYVAWLRPRADDKERITFYLGENTPADFAAAHHPFTLGEGLAGSVWQAGLAATHSAATPHPKWKIRADCKNESYVCVPVGKAAGPGGVLGFGSNQGFDTAAEQITVMETFAAILGVATGQDSWWEVGGGGTTDGGPSRPNSEPRSRARRARSTE